MDKVPLYIFEKLNRFGLQYYTDSWTYWCAAAGIFDFLHLLHIQENKKQHLLLHRLKRVQTNTLGEVNLAINSIRIPRAQNLTHKTSKFLMYFDKYKIMAGQTNHNLEFIKASAQFHAVGKIGFPQTRNPIFHPKLQ